MLLYSLQFETSRRNENDLHKLDTALHSAAQSAASNTFPRDASSNLPLPRAPLIGFEKRPNRHGAGVVVVGLNTQTFVSLSKAHSLACRHAFGDLTEQESPSGGSSVATLAAHFLDALSTMHSAAARHAFRERAVQSPTLPPGCSAPCSFAAHAFVSLSKVHCASALHAGGDNPEQSEEGGAGASGALLLLLLPFEMHSPSVNEHATLARQSLPPRFRQACSCAATTATATNKSAMVDVITGEQLGPLGQQQTAGVTGWVMG